MVIGMKRGSIVDGATLMIVILIIAISTVMMVYVNDTMVSTIQNSSMNTTFTNANAYAPMMTARNAVASLNDLIVVVLFASAVAAAIGASQVRAHPKFFFFTFVLQIFMVVMTSIVTDIYSTFIYATPEILAIAGVFPNFATILLNAPILTFIITTLIAIASFTVGGKGE